jgi:hypothetical protein
VRALLWSEFLALAEATTRLLHTSLLQSCALGVLLFPHLSLTLLDLLLLLGIGLLADSTLLALEVRNMHVVKVLNGFAESGVGMKVYVQIVEIGDSSVSNVDREVLDNNLLE